MGVFLSLRVLFLVFLIIVLQESRLYHNLFKIKITPPKTIQYPTKSGSIDVIVFDPSILFSDIFVFWTSKHKINTDKIYMRNGCSID